MDPFRCSRKPGTPLSHPEASFFDFAKPIAEVAISLSSLGDKDVIPWLALCVLGEGAAVVDVNDPSPSAWFRCCQNLPMPSKTLYELSITSDTSFIPPELGAVAACPDWLDDDSGGIRAFKSVTLLREEMSYWAFFFFILNTLPMDFIG
jgi:hypothetical protein